MNLAKYIDQTLLKPDVTKQEVENFCAQAEKYGFYAVCVQPIMVKKAVEVLKGSEVKVAAVVGFPCGSTYTESKVVEAEKCIADGAKEIDMVINQGALKEGDYEAVKYDIRQLVQVCKGVAILKVILETGHLDKEEIIKASELCADAGADYVKTSTGMLKTSKPASVEDVKLMYEVVNKHGLKVKASGGVKDFNVAKALINAGASRLGTSSGVEIIEGQPVKESSY